MTHAPSIDLASATHGIRRLASALGLEVLRQAGWSSDELVLLMGAAADITFKPTEQGANLVLHWSEEPDPELLARLEANSEMVMTALVAPPPAEVV